MQKSQNLVTQQQTPKKACWGDLQNEPQQASFRARRSRFWKPHSRRFISAPNISSAINDHAYAGETSGVILRNLLRHPFFNFFFIFFRTRRTVSHES